MREQYDKLPLGSPPTVQQLAQAIPLDRSIALLYLYDGRFGEAASWLGRGLKLSEQPGVSLVYGG